MLNRGEYQEIKSAEHLNEYITYLENIHDFVVLEKSAFINEYKRANANCRRTVISVRTKGGMFPNLSLIHHLYIHNDGTMLLNYNEMTGILTSKLETQNDVASAEELLSQQLIQRVKHFAMS